MYDFVMTVLVDDACSTATVAVAGDFDAACIERFDARIGSIPADLTAVVVDLTAATLIDSVALGALIRLTEACIAVGSTLETVVARPFQIELMHMTGPEDFLAVRTDGTADPFG